MLELCSITAGYPGRQILNELSLSVPEGQLAVVVGPNGCGKSTLLKTVAGILPSAGEILLDGISIPALSSRERARQIAFLPQNRPVPDWYSTADSPGWAIPAGTGRRIGRRRTGPWNSWGSGIFGSGIFRNCPEENGRRSTLPCFWPSRPG